MTQDALSLGGNMGGFNLADPVPATIPTTVQPDFGLVVEQLNSFLRGEISAAETYRMALDKLETEPEGASIAGLLKSIQEEHGRAAQSIRSRIRELGGQASDSSGAWGAWAKFTVGTAKLFGVNSTLKSLKEGEEHGLKDYENGLADLDTTSRELIANQLVPAQGRHIGVLDQLLTTNP